MPKLKRWYQSREMGNLVAHWWQIPLEALECLFRYRRWNFRWRVVWLYDEV